LSEDPRLAGWTPARRGFASDYSKIKIIKLVERPPSSTFDRRNRLIVHYEVSLRDGSSKARRVHFQQIRHPDLGSLENVAGYLRSKTNASDFLEFSNSLRVPESLGKTQLAEMFRRLCSYQNFLEYLRAWHPTTAKERAIRKFLGHRFRDIFELGMLAREIELISAFERDVEKAQRSQTGATKAAKISAAKRTAHANAWHGNFAQWLQPLIELETANGSSPISLEGIALLAERKWESKSGGFKGTYASQMAKPKFSTILKIVKKLEKAGELRRNKPSRGRKAGKVWR
jgi:hypothetical protein